MKISKLSFALGCIWVGLTASLAVAAAQTKTTVRHHTEFGPVNAPRGMQDCSSNTNTPPEP